MKDSCTLVFFHGTLQRSKVWGPITLRLGERLNRNITYLTPDLYENSPSDISGWIGSIKSKLSTEYYIPIGYSLGGRFALELYKQAPSAALGVMLIATDPGISAESDRAAALENDLKWAGRFEKDDWSTLMQDWNKLSVFAGIENPVPPQERDFNRDALARLWLLSSKAKTPDLWPIIPEINIPLSVVCGSLDEKFKKISQKIKEANPAVDYTEMPDTGHRIPWEKKDQFVDLLLSFLSQCGVR